MDHARRYDEECAAVRRMTRAASCVLVITGGQRGSGFSVQTIDQQYADRLPGLLRFVAGEIERGSITIRQMDE